MRMRKKKNLDSRLEMVNELLIPADPALAGKWREFFAARRKDGRSDAVTEAEFGCGKGAFAVGMAQKHPEKNFVAVEKVPDVIVLALEKAKAAGVDNLIFILGDVGPLSECFAPGELSRIYLNFSDPWPKKRHAKRRLTAPSFLHIYSKLLADGGKLILKTDNDYLFDWSLEQLAMCGWTLFDCDRDIHAYGECPDNVMTEYEKNFYEKEKNINRLIAGFEGKAGEVLSDN